MTTPYDEIIRLPHHVSKKHPHMSISDRAAQFAPFAALTGYDAAIRETGRLTEQKPELDECEKAVLNDKLTGLASRIKCRPAAHFTYFLPDALKSGGAYAEVSGTLKKIDSFQRAVIMENGLVIPFDDIVAIEEDAASSVRGE